MVLIEDRQEEVKLWKKANKLEKITKEIVGDEKIIRLGVMEGLYISDSKINVIPDFNKVVVSNANSYDLALKLAEAFEKETKESWTLKKDYFEDC